MSLKIGDKAPAFTLKNTEKEDVSLSDFSGKNVVVLFFPLAIFGSSLAGTWTIDYVFAFIIGIIFQYYSIKPMKKLSSGKALKAALKADTLSLTSWQLGM